MSTYGEMDLPSSQTLNGLFKVNVPPRKLVIDNSTAGVFSAENLECENDIPEFFLFETEIAEE